MVWIALIFMIIYSIGMSSNVIYLIKQRNRLSRMLLDIGFCPRCGESMPCTNCGAGL